MPRRVAVDWLLIRELSLGKMLTVNNTGIAMLLCVLTMAG